MKPILYTRGDSQIRVTPPVAIDAQISEREQAADCEYLPMDVYVDSRTRHARFHFTPGPAKRRKSRRNMCS